MEGISKCVVKKRKLIVILTLLLTVIFTVCFFNVKINYNMTSYLPEQANSTVALDLMDEEFGEAVPNCNVMLEDVEDVFCITGKEGGSAIRALEEETDGETLMPIHWSKKEA